MACTEGLAASFVPKAMVSCRAEAPGAAIHLRVGTRAEVSHWLLEGAVDLGLRFGSTGESGLCTEFFGSAPIVASVSPRHPISHLQRLGLRDLLAQRVAIPGVESSIHEALDRCCNALGLHHEEVFTGSLDALTWLAIQGELVMLSSHLAVSDAVAEGKLRTVSIQEFEFERRQMYVFSLAGRELPSVARLFIEHVRHAYEGSPVA